MQAKKRETERKGGKKGDTVHSVWTQAKSHSDASYTSSPPCPSFYYLLIYSF